MTIYNFFSLQIFGFEVLFKCYKFITCPGKTLKGIRGVRLDNRKVFCAQIIGPNILSAFFVIQ